MRIRVLRPFRGEEGFVKPRQVLDVRDGRAAELVRIGLATYEIGAKSNPPAPANKALQATPANKESLQPAGTPAQAAPGGEATQSHPTQEVPVAAPPIGGPTGEPTQQSSSPAAPQPPRRRSRSRKAAHE